MRRTLEIACPGRLLPRPVRFFLLIILALVAAPSAAWGSRAAVTIEGCEVLDREETERLLRVELGEAFAPERDATTFSITITCSERTLIITITAPPRAEAAQVWERRLSLDEAKTELGARVVALQAVELLRETNAPKKEVASSKASQPVPPAQKRESERPSHTFVVSAGAELLSFRGQAPLTGGEVALEVSPWWRSYLRAGVAVDGRREVLGAATVATRLTFLRGELGVRLGNDRNSIGFGAGVRWGRGRIQGSSDVPEQPTGAVESALFGPYVVTFGEAKVVGPLLLRLAGEVGGAGPTLRGRVAEHDDIVLGGLWSGISLSGCVRF